MARWVPLHRPVGEEPVGRGIGAAFWRSHDPSMHGEGTYWDKEGRKWTGQFYNGTGPGLQTL